MIEAGDQYQGEHAYTAVAVSPCPVLFAMWQGFCAADAFGSQASGMVAVWAGASRDLERVSVAAHVGEAAVTALAVAFPACCGAGGSLWAGGRGRFCGTVCHQGFYSFMGLSLAFLARVAGRAAAPFSADE